LHETEHWRPITIKEDLQAEIVKYGSFEKVIEKYFELMNKMLDTKLFDSIAHIDTIFRFCNDLVKWKPEYENFPATNQVIERCINEDIWFEINISGLNYPIKRPFPPERMVKKAIKKGAKVYIGSDSHNVKTFEEFIPKIKGLNRELKDLLL
ncbi:MAG: hypothetical protein ACTSVC_10275, partial [Promethearchaeota archaeon]